MSVISLPEYSGSDFEKKTVVRSTSLALFRQTFCSIALDIFTYCFNSMMKIMDSSCS
jgi:hypothetical protein